MKCSAHMTLLFIGAKMKCKTFIGVHSYHLISVLEYKMQILIEKLILCLN